MRIIQPHLLWQTIPSVVIAVVLLLAQETASAATASVDHMRITVYYTAAVAEAVPFFSWWSVPLMILGVVWLMRREGNFLMNHAS